MGTWVQTEDRWLTQQKLLSDKNNNFKGICSKSDPWDKTYF